MDYRPHLDRLLAATGALLLAWLLMGGAGCKPLGSEESGAAPKWSDSLGQGLRSLPDRKPGAEKADGDEARSEPFWEKWRDKRVDQINRNLSVEEPPGW